MNLAGAFEIKMSQTLVPVGSSSGEFQTFGLVDKKLTFKVTMMHGTATDTLQSALEAKTDVIMRIAWGNATPGTDDGDLAFSWNAQIEEVKNVNASGDISTIEVMGSMVGATASTDPLTVILANGQDRTW